ncbi:MAG: hypothetical protein OXU20_17300 [Myxococcales bacterium]|nr:hypothetical protein [Myxococcales bacterium]
MDEPATLSVQQLARHRLGVRAWELLATALNADGACIPVVSRSLDGARLRAARRLRSMGLVEPPDGRGPRDVRLTAVGHLVAQEVVERRRAGCQVRWVSVVASIRDRAGA